MHIFSILSLSSQIQANNVSLGGTKKLLNCHQRRKYQLIFSWLRSGVLGATAIESQVVFLFYEKSYLGGMWPLSSKLTMPRSDLRAMERHLDASR